MQIMRRIALPVVLLVAGLAVAACSTATGEEVPSPDPDVPTTSPAPSTVPTTTAPLATTTVVPVEVALRLHDYERLATRGGVTLQVTGPDGPFAQLDAANPVVSMDLVEPVDVEFTYLTPDGTPTEVTWAQRIDPESLEHVVVQPWRDLEGERERFIVAWQSQGDTAEYIRRLDAAPTVTVTSPLWWSIDEEGELRGAGDPAYVAAAHDRGGLVWPAVQGIDADGLHVLLQDTARRQAMAQQLADEAEALGSDGLNIDVEGFRDEDGAAFTLFVEEIAAAVHEWGGIVSYDLVPRSDDWDITPVELAFWSTAPERRALAEAVDYTVLMAYDQHNRFRPAGPVAAPNWVEDLIVYALRYADPHTVLLGIPAYGRLWNPAELDAPRAMAIGSLARRDGVRTPDPEFGVDRVELGDGWFYWAEQDIVADRLAFVDEYGLSGWAVWRLGLDDPSLWEAMGG